MKVDFDLSFPEIPCNLLSLDVHDESGSAQSDAIHNIYKFRISGSGSDVEIDPDTLKPRKARRPAEQHLEKVELGHTIKSEEHFSELSANASSRNQAEATNVECGDCYGAADGAHDCCATCEDIRVRYERRGWRFKPQTMRQCQDEAAARTGAEGKSDTGGCQIFGELELSKASGHFFIAPHKHMHTHLSGAGLQFGIVDLLELLSFAFDQFNITHTVNSLSFGDQYPGIKSPLDGHHKRLSVVAT